MTEKPPETAIEEPPSVPKKWKELPIADMIDKGWRPRIKEKQDGRTYITLRFGNQERSLGAYSDQNWKLLLDMYPKLKSMIRDRGKGLRGKGSLLATKIVKPKPLRGTTDISLETLAWFEWAQSRGYPGDLGDFINEIVQEYFRKEGLVRPVIVMREGN